MISKEVKTPTNDAPDHIEVQQGKCVPIASLQGAPCRHKKLNQEKLDRMHAPPVTDSRSCLLNGHGIENEVITEQSNAEEKIFNFSVLLAKLPTIVWRARWDKIAEQVGLPYRRSYMQNLSSEGTGPVEYVLNNRIYYKSEDVIRWLNERQSKQ